MPVNLQNYTLNPTIVKSLVGKEMIRMRFWAILCLGFLLLGCRQDCSEEARQGDFELSQGNFTNAVKHYERALKVDSHCGVVRQKLEETKRKAELSH